jgi:hypothetical protein
MYGKLIKQITQSCKDAAVAGIPVEQIRLRLLPEQIQSLMKEVPAQDFLEWVKEDRQYSYYFYDALQSGVCAKPAEAVAMILEAIALDSVESMPADETA